MGTLRRMNAGGRTVRPGVAADGITKHMVDLPVGSAASRGPRGLLDFVAGLKSPSHRDTGPMRGKVPQMAGRGDRHDEMKILASRVLFRPADYQRSLSLYRDAIGLGITREYGSGTVFYAGQSLIELASHGAPAESGGPFPGVLWLQVRDAYATQAERGPGVLIASWARSTISITRNVQLGRAARNLRAGVEAVNGFLAKIVAWLTAGYPERVPGHCQLEVVWTFC